MDKKLAICSGGPFDGAYFQVSTEKPNILVRDYAGMTNRRKRFACYRYDLNNKKFYWLFDTSEAYKNGTLKNKNRYREITYDGRDDQPDLEDDKKMKGLF